MDNVWKPIKLSIDSADTPSVTVQAQWFRTNSYKGVVMELSNQV